MESGNAFKFKNITAIILAGGQSRRMGRDKASLPLGEQTLLEQLIEQLAGRFQEIIISVSKGQPYPLNNVRQVEDRYENAGPLAGLLAGLQASSSDISLVVPCDQPEIDLGIVRDMLQVLGQHDLVYPRLDGQIPHPLFALYRRSLWPVIEKLINEGKLSVLHLLTEVKAVALDIPASRLPWHLNSLEDYQNYLQYLKRKRTE
ncbi:MAG TPA: molybdenum cofactor guanylyltransferase [Candidatus Saccharicenans sp.]|jgi:molybdopterin-guanine dinucleotide biosynthesis protein A|nr:molybdenum cofactor guanylyltransferase [Candidatus Saccharicenans sp.]HOL45703.1 molybdenum cofactor guanylyltransferase [Candidatus Saccharicenans sp.]HOM93670.1 molybdenum cofactor guanylyltransferase [Candidatus Saccharicenans sp.]HOT68347.1 molybdenum cofactor guanylyltransferase [Candidatus Saccharicenans sp.]HPC87725.1 molybdenum cofactor guanylyltransferase [Candidatus Saccharicenans sp.]